MHAAVVDSFDSAPHYREFPTPVPRRDTEIRIDVLTAGLHPRVRSQADGSHYTSTAELPLVPGIDGVGRGPDGLLRYFVLPDTTMGSMAEQTVVDVRRSVVLPESSDPVAVAAAMNPAMSSWIALRRRVRFEPGQSREVVLVPFGGKREVYGFRQDVRSCSAPARSSQPPGTPAGWPAWTPPTPCCWPATPTMSPAGSVRRPPRWTS